MNCNLHKRLRPRFQEFDFVFQKKRKKKIYIEEEEKKTTKDKKKKKKNPIFKGSHSK